MRIAFAAGDVGGARAILPVARQAASSGHSVLAMKHGTLAAEGDSRWNWHSTETFLAGQFWSKCADILIYATSVTDAHAICAADCARAHGKPIIHVLDNWSSYSIRLLAPSGKMVTPDIYAVMDEVAFNGAAADGVPPEILVITGHPGLAKLYDEAKAFGPAACAPPRRVLFVSEPVRQDSGDASSSAFRGYDEIEVSELLAEAISELDQMVRDDILLEVAPHPRESRDEVTLRWEKLAGKVGISQSIVAPEGVRNALHSSHVIIGMTSILLYEAWLLNKTVLSLQPDLCQPSLEALKFRQGVNFCTSRTDVIQVAKNVIKTPNESDALDLGRLRIHRGAANKIVEMASFLTNPGNLGNGSP